MNDSKKYWNYILRRVDPDLGKRVKHFCVDEGITIREFIIKSIEYYLLALLGTQEDN